MFDIIRENILATEKANAKNKMMDEIVEWVKEIRKDGSYSTEKLTKLNLSGFILLHTGMNVDFIIKKKLGMNANVKFPNLDRNHPFLSTYGYGGGSSDASTTALNLDEKLARDAWVNPSTFKVGGLWSKVKVPVTIGYELISDRYFTAGEIAAVILHELGHIFTYFRFFGELTRKNFLISDTVNVLQGNDSKEVKEQQLVQCARKLGVEINQTNEIIALPPDKRGTAAATVLITEDLINAGSSSSTGIYDVRSVEQVADQFAIYHGAGADLTTALNKLYKTHFIKETRGAGVWLAIELMKLALYLLLATSNPIGMIFFTLGILPGPKVYDSPEARVKLIKQQMIASIKEVKNSPEMVKDIHDQIEVIEQVEKQLNDRRSLLEVIYYNTTPRGRTMYKQEVFMKNIEALLYNSTYLNAAKFGALK